MSGNNDQTRHRESDRESDSPANEPGSPGSGQPDTSGGDSLNSDRNNDASRSDEQAKQVAGSYRTNTFGFGGSQNNSDRNREQTNRSGKLTDEQKRERDRERKRAERERKRAERDGRNDSGNSDDRENDETDRESTETTENEPIQEDSPRRVKYSKVIDDLDLDDSGMPKGVIAGAFRTLFSLGVMGGLGEHWYISERDSKDLAEGLVSALGTLPKASKIKYEKYLKNYFPWLMFGGAMALLVEERLTKTLEIKRMEREIASQQSVFDQENFTSSNGGFSQNASQTGSRNSAKTIVNSFYWKSKGQ